jgi:hypothetical protein
VKRLKDLVLILGDFDNTELGPLDRQDLREALCELIEKRILGSDSVPDIELPVTEAEQAA